MAPAAPGGGWDSTARAFQQASRDASLDEGVEVFNVEGAGGTLGLSQLAPNLMNAQLTLAVRDHAQIANGYLSLGADLQLSAPMQ